MTRVSTPLPKTSAIGSDPFNGKALILFTLGWWALCFALYTAGWPINYARTNFWKVAFIFLASGSAVLLGFRGLNPRITSRAVGGRPNYATTPAGLVSWRSPRLALIGLGLTCGLFVPYIAAYSGYGLGGLQTAFANQADAYAQATEQIEAGTATRSALVLAQTLAAPFTLLAIPWFGLRWFESRQYRIPILLAVGLPLTTSVLVGRDQQLGIVTLSILLAWILSRSRREIGYSRKVLFSAAALVVVVATLVTLRKVSRLGGIVRCPPGAAECSTSGVDANNLDTSLQILGSYATQGFEGLGRAFNGTWNFGGGFSHSPPLRRGAEAVFSAGDAAVITDQLNTLNWSSTGYWSTAFASIANDVPWVLVPVVYLVLGAVLKSAWSQSVVRGDPLSVTVLTYTFIALFYTPQNLQIAVSGPTYFGYAVLLLVYSLRGYTEWKANRVSGSSSMLGDSRLGPKTPG